MHAFILDFICARVNFATRNAAGKVFRPKEANKNINTINIYIYISLLSAFFQRVGGFSVVGGALPIKIHLRNPPSPHRTDRVPRELHFRHYCQVPLAPFFLPFYLQQLIRVPLPFSLLDEVSASHVKPFHFSGGVISVQAGYFCFFCTAPSQGNWGVSVRTNTLHFKLFQGPFVWNPLIDVQWITYPFDSCIMDDVEIFR